VIILTFNEEVNIAEALSSVEGSDDVVVLDCGSTDRTVEIARYHGARVVQHEFSTSAAQRQWALDHIAFANPLVFVLDADEWVTTILARELDSLSQQPPESFAAAWARSRYVYECRWIPRSSLYPSWTMRLLRVGKVRYEDRSVNEHPIADGRDLRLENDLIHEDHKPLATRMQKLDRYARLEAIETAVLSSTFRDELRSAKNWRRRVKLVHSVLPYRAATKALALLLHGGILEGKAGLHFIEESAWQERMTYRYLSELRRSGAKSIDGSGP
jgi:glycosyltransferase involved in cell wall biosynthesis